MKLAEQVIAGDRLALARTLSLVENDTPQGWSALDELFPHTGRAHLIGITGAPGTGKSSLVNQLAYAFRHPTDGTPPLRVAVIAVDPSSPFSGGALLGDRVRMRDLAGDPGVFIRSMASRGALGGLARHTAAVAQVFDAAGFDIILIETVGAGQGEVDIARLAHTTIVVEAPGLGDDIQAIKAGILEIADILVINKADRPGVEQTERALRAMLELAKPERMIMHHGRFVTFPDRTEQNEAVPGWKPFIMKTVALRGEGVQELARAVHEHGEYLRRNSEWQRRERERLEAELQSLLQAELMARWQQRVPDEMYQAIFKQVFQKTISPYQAVVKLLEQSHLF